MVGYWALFKVLSSFSMISTVGYKQQMYWFSVKILE